ncbi:siderophore ABC transporter substrate-binding protein [Clostridium botulinum]|uniref:siderophore ABC transporter substrate-binding protein n=1 Tax=Clostridium botulinum TaxID=1491 RepID=UPI0019678FE5|nr:siderophore ABC transporter substrate-binding protein [Clostridium botulinum]MBN1066265.1 ABC transporter [Clostridium botulinum]
MKNISKKTIIIVVAIIVGLFGIVEATKFAGKGSNDNNDNITITHKLGETEVSKNPERVVVFDYGVLDSLDALGINVVGVPQDGIPSYLGKYSSDQYISVGGIKEPNFEKVHEAKPDLIIISGRQEESYDEFSKIAPTIYLGIENESYIESFTNNMNTLGQIFDKEDEINKTLQGINSKIADLNKKTSESQKNGLIILANDGSFSVYGKESRFGIIHQNFGVAPVDNNVESSTHGQKASFEYLVEKNPDYLFVVDRSAVAGGQVSAQALLDNDLVKSTNAYKNNNIVYLDANVWYIATGGINTTLKMIEEVDNAF